MKSRCAACFSVQRRRSVAADEVVAAIGAAVRHRVAVDLDDVRWQFQRQVAGFVAAQTAADDQQQIDALVEFRNDRHAIAGQSSQTTRIVLRHRAASVKTAHHAESQIEQSGDCCAGLRGTTAEP
jgi:hypothetical protein